MNDYGYGPHDQNAALDLPLGTWRYIIGGCTGKIRRHTGTGCRLVIRNTSHRYLTLFFRRAHPSANSPFPDARVPCRPGTARGTIITARTGGKVPGYLRSTPPRLPSVRGVGVRYHLGALVKGIVSQTNSGSGRNAGADRQHYNTASSRDSF